MNFLKALKPFQLITSIVDRHKQNPSQTKHPQSKGKQPSPPKSESSLATFYPTPVYEEAQSFLVSLRKASAEREQSENMIRRKIDLFQKVEIEPHYLSPADDLKLLNFQFQLGSDLFLDRVENLYQQVSQINQVVRQVLATRTEDALSYLLAVDQLRLYIDKILKAVQTHRERLKILKQHTIYKISRVIKRKNQLKQKIRLLKQVKTKNQAALTPITNLDQAFATEQSRAKLYKKINKLPELQKSKYVCTIKNRLVSVSRRNKEMVEEGLKGWVGGRLGNKQIQKLAVMIYFMEREDIYRENGLQVDLSVVGKEKLRAEIEKVFEWKNFVYVKDLMTRDRIHEFLNYLLEKIG